MEKEYNQMDYQWKSTVSIEHTTIEYDQSRVKGFCKIVFPMRICF